MTKPKDPYLKLAKETRDKLVAIVHEAEQGGGIGCLLNCNDSGDVIINALLESVQIRIYQAADAMTALVKRLEERAVHTVRYLKED